MGQISTSDPSGEGVGAALGGVERVDLSQGLGTKGALWNGSSGVEMERRLLDMDLGAPGTEVCFTQLSFPSHVGTHVDAPRHIFADGSTIDEYGPDRFIRPAIAVDARRQGAVPLGRAELQQAAPAIRPGDVVLVCFGYGERFGTADYYEHPYLAVDAADYLVEAGVSMVGVDTLTPDLPGVKRPPEGYDLPVHRILLGADVLIIENLGPRLARLVGRRFLLIAPPIRVEGADAAPAVPIALLEGGPANA